MNTTIKNILIFSIIILSLIFTGCFEKDPVAPTNNPPVVNSVQVNPPSVAANGVATVTVNATDTNVNDQLTYDYDISGNGAINAFGASAQWTAPGVAGAYSVKVTVKDGHGGEATGTGNLSVTAPVTQVAGSASFPAGVNGNLYNAKVSLYTSLANWNNYSHIKFVPAQGEGAYVTFTIPNVNPGNYYLDVWKDNDNDGAWSTGDFVGWYGSGGLAAPSLTEFQISAGQTVTINVSMIII